MNSFFSVPIAKLPWWLVCCWSLNGSSFTNQWQVLISTWKHEAATTMFHCGDIFSMRRGDISNRLFPIKDREIWNQNIQWRTSKTDSSSPVSGVSLVLPKHFAKNNISSYVDTCPLKSLGSGLFTCSNLVSAGSDRVRCLCSQSMDWDHSCHTFLCSQGKVLELIVAGLNSHTENRKDRRRNTYQPQHLGANLA